MSNHSELVIDLTERAFSFEELERLLRKRFPGQQLLPRANFGLYFEFVNWLKTGRKITTIRYRRHGIDLPKARFLDLVETKDFSKAYNDKLDEKVGRVEINKMVFRRFRTLTEQDAKSDGFRSLEELKKVFIQIYGEIEADEPVTIYHIGLI